MNPKVIIYESNYPERILGLNMQQIIFLHTSTLGCLGYIFSFSPSPPTPLLSLCFVVCLNYSWSRNVVHIFLKLWVFELEGKNFK